eukprot:g13775.t1
MIDSWLKEQLDLLEAGLEQAVKEDSVATLSMAGSRTDTPPGAKIDGWLKAQLETNLDSVLREGSVATLDMESVASVPLVQLPYVDMRPKGPASSVVTSSIGQGPSVTVLDFTFEDMDYDAVISSSQLCGSVVEAIQRGVAEQAGIQADQVRACVSDCAVREIACADVGSAAVVAHRALQKDGALLLKAVSEHVAKVPGISLAHKGGDLNAKGLRLKVAPTGRPMSAKFREEVLRDVASEAAKKALQMPGEESHSLIVIHVVGWQDLLKEEARLEEERIKEVHAAVAAASFEDLDTNNDGVISREEFHDFVQKESKRQKESKLFFCGTTAETQAPEKQEEAAPLSPSFEDEDPETIQERVQEVLEENSRLRSENEALRVELEHLLALTVTPEITPPQTGGR